MADPAAKAQASDPAAGVLVRINARAWGVALGGLLGAGLCLATLILVWKGGPDVGQHLGRLSYVLPGYDVSYRGALLGLVYGFFVGYAIGRLLGPSRDASGDVAEEGRHVRLSPRSWGLTLGVLLALALFTMTNVLALRGGSDAGSLLRELHIYFPGYTVDFAGSLIGCAYVLALGWVVGMSVAVLYNRALARAEA